jgi:hypothetical protein
MNAGRSTQRSELMDRQIDKSEEDRGQIVEAAVRRTQPVDHDLRREGQRRRPRGTSAANG